MLHFREVFGHVSKTEHDAAFPNTILWNFTFFCWEIPVIGRVKNQDLRLWRVQLLEGLHRSRSHMLIGIGEQVRKVAFG